MNRIYDNKRMGMILYSRHLCPCKQTKQMNSGDTDYAYKQSRVIYQQLTYLEFYLDVCRLFLVT